VHQAPASGQRSKIGRLLPEQNDRHRVSRKPFIETMTPEGANMTTGGFLRSLATEIVGVSVDKDSAVETPLSSNPLTSRSAGGNDDGLPNIAEPLHQETSDTTIIALLGQATSSVWGDISRDVQEAIFENAALNHPELRTALAEYLHQRHPKTLHPPQPTALA
jgi:hypothetical protein